MANNRRWTNDEEQVIISKVASNCGNISEAFKQASLEIDRTIPAISCRWYTIISKHPTTKVFITYGKDNVVVNRKNSNEPIAIKKNIFSKVIDYIFGKNTSK